MYFNFGNAINIIGTIILFVSSIVLSLNQKKRNKYVLRLILCCLGSSLITFFVTGIVFSYDNPYLSIISLVINELVIFALVFVSLLICYSIKVKTALMKVTTLFLATILSCSITYLMLDAIFGLNNFPEFFYLIYYLIEIVCCTITILVFRQRLKAYEEKNYKVKVIILSLGLFLIGLIMNSFVQTEYYLSDSLLNNIMFNILMSFYCLSTIYVSYRNIDDEKQSLKDQLIASKLAQEAKQFKLEKENLKNIDVKNQTLNNKFYFLDGNVDKTTLNELQDLSLIYDDKISTGNETLDLVLKEKSFSSQNKHIEFVALANGRCLSFIANNDLYSLMNNLLNKAEEECSTLKDEDKKSISLNIRDTSLYESIHLEYYFNDMYLDNNGVLVKKANLVNDDLDQQTINYLVKKYNGIITYTSDNDILIVDIVFCKNVI